MDSYSTLKFNNKVGNSYIPIPFLEIGDHIKIASAYLNLGNVKDKQGKLEDAGNLYGEVFRCLGVNPNQSRHYLNAFVSKDADLDKKRNLANAFMGLGRLSFQRYNFFTALENFENAFIFFNRAYGPEHCDIQENKNLMVECASKVGALTTIINLSCVLGQAIRNYARDPNIISHTTATLHSFLCDRRNDIFHQLLWGDVFSAKIAELSGDIIISLAKDKLLFIELSSDASKKDAFITRGCFINNL